MDSRGFINIFGTHGSRQRRRGISYVFHINPVQISKIQAGDKARVEGTNPHLPPLNDTPGIGCLPCTQVVEDSTPTGGTYPNNFSDPIDQ